MFGLTPHCYFSNQKGQLHGRSPQNEEFVARIFEKEWSKKSDYFGIAGAYFHWQV